MNVHGLGSGNSNGSGGGKGIKTAKSGNTQVITKRDNRSNQKKKDNKSNTKIDKNVKVKAKGKGVIIGEGQSRQKWRCVVCTFLNPAQAITCNTCQTPRDGEQSQDDD